jgi:hypothetical protein
LFRIAPLTAAVFLVALPLLLVGLHAVHKIDGDEGVVLFGAWSLLSGHQPYIDDFQFITPASNYLLYWGWRLFGPNFWIASGLSITSIYLTSVAIYLTSKQLRSDDPLTLGAYVGAFCYSALSVFWTTINHNTFNACAMSWALYFGVKHVLHRKPRELVFCGLLTGLAILFVQHKGAVLLLAIMLCLVAFNVREPREHALKTLGLYCGSLLVPLLTLLAWPPGVLFEHLITFPATRYLSINKTSALPLVLMTGFFIAVSVSTLRGGNRALVLVWVVQALLLGTCLQRPDVSHVFILSFPTLAMLSLLLDRLGLKIASLEKFRRLSSWARKLAITLVMMSIGLVLAVRKPNFEDLPANWPLLREAASRCKSIYAGPFLPGIYYELRLQNPTSFGFLLTNFHTQEQFVMARRQLELARPQCVMTHYDNLGNFNYDLQNPVEEYIAGHYVVHQSSAGTRLLLRRD